MSHFRVGSRQHSLVERMLAVNGREREMTVPPPANSGNRAPAKPPPRRFHPLFLLPMAGLLGLVVAFALGLRSDPSLVPSPLVGRPVPVFALPPVEGQSLGLSSRDLQGEVSLVNVFASWCVSCREEHPLLLRLKKSGFIPIHGLDYKDKPSDAARWLAQLGDPYTRTGADIDGRVAIDWGVYGVPETFVVDRRGVIAYKQVGPVTQDILDWKLAPLIAQLRQIPAVSATGRPRE
jgi:cytochrome c biogenesis protein CcmG, thiol:disulfide interchange protein DsbE